MKKVICFISNQEIEESQAKKIEDILPALFSLIQKDYPNIERKGWIFAEVFNKYRKQYLTSLVMEEEGEINRQESDVVKSIANNKILSENIDADIEDKLTIGQKLADRIATFGGSWIFIIFFFSFIAAWILINILLKTVFDPYPYILLNLILSCLAAIQAPIIMMSQNRQEQKDRLRSEHDYKINLKAEIEIKLLHEKVDHLMIRQSTRLLEIQEIQAEYLEEILEKLRFAS